MLVVIPAVVTAISAPVPAPIKVGSKSSVSAPYPDPPEIISALVTAPPATAADRTRSAVRTIPLEALPVG